MEFIENNNYTERVYNVDINKDKLKELLNKIIKELNYKVYGEYILSNDLEVDFKNKKIISGACLPNGDDLFVNDKKLSVSIATKSVNSVLIHTGINIISEGAPIEASGLKSDLNMTNIKEFAIKVMKNYNEELDDIILASTKVRGV